MPDDPPRRSSRYDALDLWRGFACLLVLVNHSVFYKVATAGATSAWALANGGLSAVAARLWLGVPLFFVISGYCISATIDSHRRKNAGVRAYFFKRFRRIFPPYWATLAGAAVLVGASDIVLHGAVTSGGGLRPWWFSAWQWAGSLTLTEIWRWHLIGGPKGLTLGPAWTLCYEEQFYAVTGALLFLAPRRFFTGAVLVTVAVLAAAWGTAKAGIDIDGFFFDGAWIQFALGILVYYVINYRRDDDRAKIAASAVFGVVIAWALSFGPQLLDLQKNSGQSMLVASGFALLALWLHPFDVRITQHRTMQPMKVCGMMCYSLYLVQVPIIGVIRGLLVWSGVGVDQLSPLISLPLCCIPTLWIAWRFHVAVERRFMSPASASAAAPLPLATAV
ncbi:MAG TPA: acyltransferase [Vicinamibacterales bacterium]|nr:acyltransferase [Vicinamibacterales bacterium]